jgi:hypothetical protein
MTNRTLSEKPVRLKPNNQRRSAGTEESRLDVFLGKWNKEGKAYESPFGPEAGITARETYEWLPGGVFLVHRLEGRVGNQEIACIEIIEYEAASHGYTVRSFYNNGTSNIWQCRESDGRWITEGDWEIEGESLKVRCFAQFNPAGTAMTGKWEYSLDGASWQLFWDTRLTKV